MKNTTYGTTNKKQQQKAIVKVEKITIDGYKVTLKLVDFTFGHKLGLGNKLQSALIHWNAYVILPILDLMPISPICNETFREGNVVGVDTGHYGNVGQSLDAKKHDALLQIQHIVDEYEKVMKFSTVRFEKKSPIINTRACVRARTSHDGKK